MSLNVSRKQLNVLNTLKSLADSQGYMPSVRELATAIELSPATTQQHLNALRKKGLIRMDGSAHGIRIVEGPPIRVGAPRTGRTPVSVARPETTEEVSSILVPIAGRIAAGRPIEAIESHSDSLPLSPSLVKPGDYLLRVQGQSMIEDGILDGDLVLIRPQERVDNGQIAVALLDDGSATLKRVYQEKDSIRLQPANREMDPIYVTDLRVQGRVVGLVRIYSNN